MALNNNEEIKALWKTFKEQHSDTKDEIKNGVEALLDGWKQYKTKINDDTFSLDDYTNRLDNDPKPSMPGGYLCNFLERTTRELLGSSKPGNAQNFGVKLNEGGTYYLGEDSKSRQKDEAEEKFKKSLLPLIKEISKSDINHIFNYVERSDYSAKQILRKLAVLDHLDEFLFIYSDGMIDDLYEQFQGTRDDQITNLGKSAAIRRWANNLFSFTGNDHAASVLISRFLWKYANTKSLVDSDTPNVILYGPPGTGKTYEVKSTLDFICKGDRSRYEFVQFHPSFTYEDFIEGIKPKGVSKDGNIKFELVNGIFKEFCIRAKNNPEQDYYFVVDEINRANISSVFGEALLCLEKDYRHDPADKSNTTTLIKTQYSTLISEMIKEDPDKESLAYEYIDGNVYFGVPKNVFFIGMMNDVDKSIDAFDLALRRRFKWIRKDCDYDVIQQYTKFRNGDVFENIDPYITACKKLNGYISEELGLGKSYEFGHSFFMKMTSIANSTRIIDKNIETLFELHLRPTLKEYLRAMFAENELDAKLDEALSKFKLKKLSKEK
jgi:hypothetical protein